MACGCGPRIFRKFAVCLLNRSSYFKQAVVFSSQRTARLTELASLADIPMEQGDVDHSNVDSGDDSLPLIVDEADELEQRPGVAADDSSSSMPLYRANANPNSFHELSRPQLAWLEQLAKGKRHYGTPPFLLFRCEACAMLRLLLKITVPA